MASTLPPVLITYGWCRTAYSVAYSLGKRGVPVHVVDSSPLAMTRYSRFVQSFNIVPDFYTHPNEYFDAISRILENTGSEVLLPAHEDIEVFIKRRVELPQHVKTAFPEYDSYLAASDKFVFSCRLAQSGCPVPDTIAISSADQLKKLPDKLGFPIVLKTHRGNSAKGVRIAHSETELEKLFSELVETFHLSDGNLPVAQAYLPGAKAGTLLALDRGRYLCGASISYIRCKEGNDFGTSSFRISTDNPELIDMSMKALSALNWHGVADLDFMKDKYGCFKLIEINGRLGGTVPLAIAAGADLAWMWYLAALGQSPSEPVTAKGGVKGRWLVGEGISLMDRLRHLKFKQAAEIFVPQFAEHDDFHIDDPLPLFFESCDYIRKFATSSGSLNPVQEGMIR